MVRFYIVHYHYNLYIIHLDISQLDEILQILKRSNFSSQKWFPLGLSLSLPKPKLDAIKAEPSNDPSQCLQECLSLWLSKTDEVVEKGEPTWNLLASALRNIGEVAAAETIEISKNFMIYNILYFCLY